MNLHWTITLADLPDSILDRLSDLHCNAVFEDDARRALASNPIENVKQDCEDLYVLFTLQEIASTRVV